MYAIKTHKNQREEDSTDERYTIFCRELGPIQEKIRSLKMWFVSSRFLDPTGFHERSCSDRIMILAILLATWIGVGSEISTQQLVILSVISP